MRTEVVNLFKFSELSETAKERARDWYLDRYEFPWSGEYRDTIDKFRSTFFCVDYVEWSVNPNCGHAHLTLNGNALDLSGTRLYKYLVNNYWHILTEAKAYVVMGKDCNRVRYSRINKVHLCCPFTGFCADDDLLDPLYKFLKGPKNYPGWNTVTYEDILRAMASSWAKAYADDWGFLMSDEAVDEAFESNEYEFTANGAKF